MRCPGLRIHGRRPDDAWQIPWPQPIAQALDPTTPRSPPAAGYVYAYGQLLALSVYERYEQTGPELVPRYVEMLAAGGSRPPEELGAIVGVDLADPGFWDAGLDLVERQLHEAEAAAEDSGWI